MGTKESIEEIIEDAARIEKKIKQLISESKDYDLSRLLKKVDAEMMDLQHSLNVTFKFAAGKQED